MSSTWVRIGTNQQNEQYIVENKSSISYQKNIYIEMIFDQTSSISWLFVSKPYNWGHVNSYVTLDVWNLKATSPFSWREHQLSPSKANVVYF